MAKRRASQRERASGAVPSGALSTSKKPKTTSTVQEKTTLTAAASRPRRGANPHGKRHLPATPSSQSSAKEPDCTVDPIIDDNVPSPESSTVTSCRKRKRDEAETERSCGAIANKEPKRISHAGHLNPEPDLSDRRNRAVNHWVQQDFNWSGATEEGRLQATMKRTLSNSSTADSYNKAAAQGIVAKAWTREHAQEMEGAGIYLEGNAGATITDKDQQLLDEILQHECEVPDEWVFRKQNFSDLLARVRYRNEARVERDLSPLISPSMEMLHARGYTDLAFVGEAYNAEWSKTTRLHGPKPKPDATYGVSRQNFTTEELVKLTSHTTAKVEDTIFPFFVRQAKCFDGDLAKAELQALHNTSVAVNTMVELHRDTPNGAENLHKRVLAFSMVHNHHIVKWFAHFVMIDAKKTTFHRQLMFEMDLNGPQSDFTRSFKILVGICVHFGRIHLKRIETAISNLPEPAVQSFAARLGLESDGQNTVISKPSSSQDNGRSKRPSLSLTARLQQDKDELQERFDKLFEQSAAKEEQLSLAARIQQEANDKLQERFDKLFEQSAAKEEQLSLAARIQQEANDKLQERFDKLFEQSAAKEEQLSLAARIQQEANDKLQERFDKLFEQSAAEKEQRSLAAKTQQEANDKLQERFDKLFEQSAAEKEQMAKQMAKLIEQLAAEKQQSAKQQEKIIELLERPRH